jgi:hypothetical protein
MRAVRQKEGIRDDKGLKNFLRPKGRIYFVDGMHPQHNAMSAREWIEKMGQRWLNCEKKYLTKLPLPS